MKGKIVFVSHVASLSGAPILLLNLLTYLKSKIPYEFIVVLQVDGPIRARFEEICPVIVYSEIKTSGRSARLLHRLRVNEAINSRRLRQVFALDNVKLIFSNTIANGELVDSINFSKVPVVTYVHELAYAMQALGQVTVQKALHQTTGFLAGSGAVQQELMRIGVAADKVRVIPSSVPYVSLSAQLSTIDTVAERAKLGIGLNQHVVVAAGTAEWRKGSDLFVQMAAIIASKPQMDTHFIWVGGNRGSIEHFQMQYDIDRMGLSQRVHILAVTPDYLKYIALADVFVLTSREDPFPLVILEAAVASKPIVCFANSGGSPEFIGTENGVVVSYSDVNELAETVVLLLSDSELRAQKGNNAHTLVREHYDTSVMATQIGYAIEQYVK